MQDDRLIKRLLSYLKPYKKSLIFAMVGMIFVSALSSAQAYLVKPLLDQIFFTKNRAMLNLLPFALVLVFLFKGGFQYLYSYILDTTGQNVIRDLRKQLFSHIHSLPLSFFHHTPTGELIARVINDVNWIQIAASRTIVAALKDIFQIIGLVVVIVYLDWKLAIISLVFLPIAAGSVIHFGKKFRKLSINNQRTVAILSNILHETITGHRIVKAFCMEKYETKKFSDMIDRLFKIIVKDIRINCLQSPLMEFFGGICIAGVIWYGGQGVFKGESTPGTFFAFLVALIMLYDPIKAVSNINSPIQRGMAAASRVFSLLDVQPEIVDKADAVPLPPFKESVEFKDVCFSYDGKEMVLKNINLLVKAGEAVAFVGTSGGGKTTIANLIPRFFDVTSGSIRIDQKDIRDVTVQSLRNQIAIVSQQTILFNDTVKNNIAYGDIERTEEEIIAAAKAANAIDFINELPKGFETVIGEAGARLSGGQQQRLAIARALLKDAPILILDEATSALDTESEREVQKALENLMKNRTTFLIAHRLSTIKNADRIIVIQNGKITEEGNHDTLIAKKGTYEMLYFMQ